MIRYPHLLGHMLSRRYTTIFYCSTRYLFGTIPARIGPLTIPMVHFYLLLAHLISLWYTTSPIDPLAILMVHYTLLLAHWLSLWYTTFFYWPNGYLYCTQPSPTGRLDISIVHCYPLLTHWISLWYKTLS